LSYLCRHDKELTPDANGFVSIGDIVLKTGRKFAYTGNLAEHRLRKSKSNISVVFPSGPREWSRTKTVPEIGIRAAQGHSERSDISAEFLTAAQERLVHNSDTFSTLPLVLCTRNSHAGLASFCCDPSR
jgi:RNA:NAD 2'-phosphotransferase (TPT1/KptA family)